ncbi:helix-turn-helix domain-containing protein [Aestuariicella hydrocarbonica]|uniref:Helix-turn-helix domain-containing protein n=1 Tax=Pseudomaricurvus hydrocarbonicus TaxID=1470433 RepID=A0A9E5MKH1_9GAMM|nr:helix-turn-helix domain-containing protein [Aestuariicella hydrocarbonica]NHO65377.1 helix-turn-helix domain-containing protein [Aestuariicella hydrocarbonica]
MAEPMGSRLKAIREFYGWSQRERAGVPNSAISVIEQGSVSPSVSSLEKVLKGFPLSIADFFAVSTTRQQAKVRHEELGEAKDSLVARFATDAGREIVIRSMQAGPEDPPVNLMARGQTMVLLVKGEANYHSLGVEHHLICGSNLTVQITTPFRLEPLVEDTRWIVVGLF